MLNDKATSSKRVTPELHKFNERRNELDRELYELDNSVIALKHKQCTSNESKSEIELIRRLRYEKRKREYRNYCKQKELEERIRASIDLEKQQAIDLLKNKIMKIKERNFQKHASLRQQREKDIQQLELIKEQVLIIPEEERLYKKLERQYNLDVVIPSLEHSKEELVKRRKAFRRVPIQEIIRHRKHHSLIIEEKREKWKNEWEKRTTEIKKQYQVRKLHKSAIGSIIRNEQDKVDRKLMKEKANNYNTLVRALNPVVIDKKKVEQLKVLIEKTKSVVRKTKDKEEIKKLYNIANIRLESKDSSTSEKKHVSSLSSSKVSTDTKEPIKKDYLTEVKRQHKLKLYSPTKRLNWEDDLNNHSISENKKYEKVMEKAEKTTKQAKVKEKLLTLLGKKELTMENIEVNESIAEMIVDSIKAKMAIFDKL